MPCLSFGSKKVKEEYLDLIFSKIHECQEDKHANYPSKTWPFKNTREIDLIKSHGYFYEQGKYCLQNSAIAPTLVAEKRPMVPFAADNNLVQIKVFGKARGSLLDAESIRHISAHIDHINMVLPRKVIHTKENNVALITDFCQGVQIDKFMRQYEHRTTVAKPLFQQIMSCFNYCHFRRLLHFNLTTASIYVKDGSVPLVQITDFGMPVMRDIHRMENIFGKSARFSFEAPEVLSEVSNENKTAATTEKSNIYTLGVILYQILTGDLPYIGTKNQVLAKSSSKSLGFSGNVSPKIKDLIGKMIHPKGFYRPSAKTCLEHSWLAGMKLDDQKEKSSPIKKNLDKLWQEYADRCTKRQCGLPLGPWSDENVIAMPKEPKKRSFGTDTCSLLETRDTGTQTEFDVFFPECQRGQGAQTTESEKQMKSEIDMQRYVALKHGEYLREQQNRPYSSDIEYTQVWCPKKNGLLPKSEEIVQESYNIDEEKSHLPKSEEIMSKSYKDPKMERNLNLKKRKMTRLQEMVDASRREQHLCNTSPEPVNISQFKAPTKELQRDFYGRPVEAVQYQVHVEYTNWQNQNKYQLAPHESKAHHYAQAEKYMPEMLIQEARSQPALIFSGPNYPHKQPSDDEGSVNYTREWVMSMPSTKPETFVPDPTLEDSPENGDNPYLVEPKSIYKKNDKFEQHKQDILQQLKTGVNKKISSPVVELSASSTETNKCHSDVKNLESAQIKERKIVAKRDCSAAKLKKRKQQVLKEEAIVDVAGQRKIQVVSRANKKDLVSSEMKKNVIADKHEGPMKSATNKQSQKAARNVNPASAILRPDFTSQSSQEIHFVSSAKARTKEEEVAAEVTQPSNNAARKKPRRKRAEPDHSSDHTENTTHKVSKTPAMVLAIKADEKVKKDMGVKDKQLLNVTTRKCPRKRCKTTDKPTITAAKKCAKKGENAEATPTSVTKEEITDSQGVVGHDEDEKPHQNNIVARRRPHEIRNTEPILIAMEREKMREENLDASADEEEVQQSNTALRRQPSKGKNTDFTDTGIGKEEIEVNAVITPEVQRRLPRLKSQEQSGMKKKLRKRKQLQKEAEKKDQAMQPKIKSSSPREKLMDDEMIDSDDNVDEGLQGVAPASNEDKSAATTSDENSTDDGKDEVLKPEDMLEKNVVNSPPATTTGTMRSDMTDPGKAQENYGIVKKSVKYENSYLELSKKAQKKKKQLEEAARKAEKKEEKEKMKEAKKLQKEEKKQMKKEAKIQRKLGKKEKKTHKNGDIERMDLEPKADESNLEYDEKRNSVSEDAKEQKNAKEQDNSEVEEEKALVEEQENEEIATDEIDNTEDMKPVEGEKKGDMTENVQEKEKNTLEIAAKQEKKEREEAKKEEKKEKKMAKKEEKKEKKEAKKEMEAAKKEEKKEKKMAKKEKNVAKKEKKAEKLANKEEKKVKKEEKKKEIKDAIKTKKQEKKQAKIGKKQAKKLEKEKCKKNQKMAAANNNEAQEASTIQKQKTEDSQEAPENETKVAEEPQIVSTADVQKDNPSTNVRSDVTPDLKEEHDGEADKNEAAGTLVNECKINEEEPKPVLNTLKILKVKSVHGSDNESEDEQIINNPKIIQVKSLNNSDDESEDEQIMNTPKTIQVKSLNNSDDESKDDKRIMQSPVECKILLNEARTDITAKMGIHEEEIKPMHNTRLISVKSANPEESKNEEPEESKQQLLVKGPQERQMGNVRVITVKSSSPENHENMEDSKTSPDREAQRKVKQAGTENLGLKKAWTNDETKEEGKGEVKETETERAGKKMAWGIAKTEEEEKQVTTTQVEEEKVEKAAESPITEVVEKDVKNVKVMETIIQPPSTPAGRSYGSAKKGKKSFWSKKRMPKTTIEKLMARQDAHHGEAAKKEAKKEKKAEKERLKIEKKALKKEKKDAKKKEKERPVTVLDMMKEAEKESHEIANMVKACLEETTPKKVETPKSPSRPVVPGENPLLDSVIAGYKAKCEIEYDRTPVMAFVPDESDSSEGSDFRKASSGKPLEKTSKGATLAWN